MLKSAIRLSALSIVANSPSWVCVKETALVTLLKATSFRAIWLAKRVLTAKPAASSEGVTIFDPDDNLESDLARLAEFTDKKVEVLRA
jgi:hypothetical protein